MLDEVFLLSIFSEKDAISSIVEFGCCDQPGFTTKEPLRRHEKGFSSLDYTSDDDIVDDEIVVTFTYARLV